MISVLVAVTSVFVFMALFILFRAVRQKPFCNVIITALSTRDIADLLAASENTKADSIYIVTNDYDEKYFHYLKKHYFIREVLTVVDRNN